MSKLHERLNMDCPYVRARQYLRESIGPLADSTLPVILHLKATIPMTNVEFAKDVRVTYARAEDPMHFDEVWRVGWTPEPGGVYPAFEGNLTVRAGDTYECSILELEGEYEPPLGTAGHAFDAALGHRIAAATAQNLLAAIAEVMQARYKREEIAKKDALFPS